MGSESISSWRRSVCSNWFCTTVNQISTRFAVCTEEIRETYGNSELADGPVPGSLDGGPERSERNRKQCVEPEHAGLYARGGELAAYGCRDAERHHLQRRNHEYGDVCA